MPRYSVNPIRTFTVNQDFPVYRQSADVYPDSVRLTGGDFVVVWYTPGDPTFVPSVPGGVAIQRYNADGTPDGEALRIAEGAGFFPHVAALADGGYVVAWTRQGGFNHIEYQRFDANGALVGGIVQASAPGAGFDTTPEMIGLPDGGFTITWQRIPELGGDADVYSRTFDSAGVGGAETLLSTESGDASDPVAIVLQDGSLAYFWTRNVGAPDEEVRFSHNGVQSVINGVGSGDDINAKLLPNGKIVLVWTGSDGVYANILAADGGAGVPFLVHANATDADVAVFPDGNFVIVWSTFPNDNIGARTMQGQAYDVNGAPLQGGFFEHAQSYLRGGDEQLTVTVTGAHEFFVGFSAYGQPDELQGVLFNLHPAIDFVGTPGNDQFTGGDGNDTAQGLGGNDTLDGGAGGDRLEGGLGDDIYFVDTTADEVFEAVGAGNDIVYARTTYGLREGQEIEALAAENASGTEWLTLSGNKLTQTITGNAGANLLWDGGGGNDVLIGLGGDDSYSITSAGAQVVEAAGGGNDTVSASVAYTLDAGQSVEIMETKAGVAITGNELVQEMRGSDDHADTLNGGGGADIMRGYRGDDLYYVDNVGDQVFEEVGGGVADRVRTTISYQLTAGQDIDFLETTDAGGTGALNLTGNAFRQTITGNAGANVIQGFGGVDILVGLGGNDTYYVDVVRTSVQEATGGGNDAVYVSVSYVLTAGSSVETLSTVSHAATTSINLTGNKENQTLLGNAGANILHGGGGTDILAGFGGNDTYYTDVATTTVIEAAGGGNDALYTSVSYVLGAGQEVEILSTNSHGATTAINLTGNGLNQTLLGNAGANVLHGGGGTDLLIGFGGDDVYYTDVLTTRIQEQVGGGSDTVYTSVSYILTQDQDIEHLSTNNHAATVAINLTGNGLSQSIQGNAGNNIIHGAGGTDLLVGFGGNDTYYTDVAATRVIEVAGGGNDALYVGVSYVLEAGQEIETLSTNSHAATIAMDLTGNSYNQTIFGNAGANTLNGGLGNDTMRGFGGADNFVFDTALGTSNIDTVADFVSGTDKLQLDDSVFAGIGGLGTLGAGAFLTGTAAADADDRIIYDAATGQLFFDADGNGAGAAVLFAMLTGAPALIASDIQII